MKFIDAHGHLFPEKIAWKSKDIVSRFYDLPMYTAGAMEELLKIKNAPGETYTLEKQLVCSPSTSPAQTHSINLFISAMCAEHNFLVGLGTLHPGNENFEEELDFIQESGLKGVKFHSDFQQFNIDDDAMFPVYESISRRRLPILFHMGDGKYDFSHPRRLARLLSIYPDLVVMASHMGGYLHWQEAYDLPVCENLFFDLSSTLAFIQPEDLRRMVDKFGVEKFFFGSDFPMWNAYRELDRLKTFGLTDEEFQKIIYDNFVAFEEKYLS
ncbi:MAG: amidohydrolase family protein [Lachnospiraceae bacterium]|nr:amidohydrolase family protein [Lachnospiraceae bacterium]